MKKLALSALRLGFPVDVDRAVRRLTELLTAFVNGSSMRRLEPATRDESLR